MFPRAAEIATISEGLRWAEAAHVNGKHRVTFARILVWLEDALLDLLLLIVTVIVIVRISDERGYISRGIDDAFVLGTQRNVERCRNVNAWLGKKLDTLQPIALQPIGGDFAWVDRDWGQAQG